MINTERVMDLTEAYLHSYKLALSETKNSQLAINVAYAVTHIIADGSPAVKEEQPTSPLQTMIVSAFTNAAKAACERAAEEEDDGEEDDPAPGE